MADAPTAGARFMFERQQDRGASARYRAEVVTPDGRFEYQAELFDDERVELTATAAAPAELEDALRMIAKLTARSASVRRRDGLVPWPPRITRWRGPGRGG